MGMNRAARLMSRGTRLASLCALVAMLASSAGAGAERTGPPLRLIDGSTPPAVPTALKGRHGPLAATRVRLVRVAQRRAQVAACVPGDRVPGGRQVVERIDVSGRTLTFLGLSSAVDGCDRTPRAVSRPWCGRAAWPLRHRRVSDARLSICTDSRGRPVAAFAWIDPLRRAAWIVVHQPGFGEVYPVAGRLPVRVSTVAGIEYGRAIFRYTEYDVRGVMLARRTITPAIAG
jgi:hypothetical protein